MYVFKCWLLSTGESVEEKTFQDKSEALAHFEDAANGCNNQAYAFSVDAPDGSQIVTWDKWMGVEWEADKPRPLTA